MEDNKKNFLDLSEIDRIQQEIERNLYSVPQADKNYADKEKYVNPNITIDEAGKAGAGSYYNSSAAPSAGKGAAAPNTFYHDTVKNESTRNKKKKFRRSVTYILIICTLGSGALGMGLGFGARFANNYYSGIKNEESVNYISKSEQNGSQPGSAPIYQTAMSDNKAVVINTMSDVIKLIAPSVVSITAVFDQNQTAFSLPYIEEGGSGSGIIFKQDSEKIYIATNYHVIAGASSVSINIEDSEGIPAAFFGSDPGSDLAVISVSKADIDEAGVKSVSIAVFGDSAKMQVGDPVYAIGNAMGEGNIVTSGIVSANNKEILTEANKLTVIQTDAAINPGNSGGPLINRFGEVIGVNTAKLSRADVEGMGYSITSDIAKPVLDKIMQQIPKPFLGIRGLDISKEQAGIFNIPASGVLVQEVVPGSSAQKAGIQRLDVITGFNGEAVFNMETLTEAIQKCVVGEEVTVKIYRNGSSQMEIKVKLAEYKTDNF